MSNAAIDSPNFPAPLPDRPHVKICGLTRAADALLALELGATFLGVIMTPKSPRFVDEDAARELLRQVRAGAGQTPRIVGVFTNEDPAEIAQLQKSLNLFAVQIHGPLTSHVRHLDPSRIIPAVNIRSVADAESLARQDRAHGAVLADAFSPGAAGGTGIVFDHSLVTNLYGQRRVFLAGGISPDNIAAIIAAHAGVFPYAIDLSSGVEDSPGIKSHEKLRKFFSGFNAAIGAV